MCVPDMFSGLERLEPELDPGTIERYSKSRVIPLMPVFH